MTPAQKLAAHKPKRKTKPPKVGVWNCRVREFREALGLSLRDVADAIEMSNPGLHAIEHGGEPVLSSCWKLSEFFGVPIAELWVKP